MADYNKMTVERLRGLARDRLGPGHSKRTKLELVRLLEDAEGGKAPPAKVKPTVKAAPAARAARAERKPAAEKPPASEKKLAAEKKVAAAKPPAARARRPAAAKAGAAPRGPSEEEAAAAAPGAEGYFVARVRGEDAVRDAPHPLTETTRDAPPSREPGQVLDEDLGELPWGYGDDTFMALPRDPRTLFLFWDLAGETTSAAFAGLDGGRAELRILARAGAGWDEVRRVEFALESRGFYVHDLEPGRIYRAEIHAVDRRGADRLVGQSSNEMMLPPLGPSPVIDDRFIRIPWDMPLGRLLGPGHAGGPFSDEARTLLARLSDWSRFGGGGGSAGGIGGALGGARGPGLGGGGSGAGMAGSGSGRGP